MTCEGISYIFVFLLKGFVEKKHFLWWTSFFFAALSSLSFNWWLNSNLYIISEIQTSSPAFLCVFSPSELFPLYREDPYAFIHPPEVSFKIDLIWITVNVKFEYLLVCENNNKNPPWLSRPADMNWLVLFWEVNPDPDVVSRLLWSDIPSNLVEACKEHLHSLRAAR